MSLVLRCLSVALLLGAVTTQLHAQGGVLPKTLIVPGSPEAASQLSVKDDGQTTATSAGDSIAVVIKPGDNPYPGVTIKPAGGSPWDLGLYGHVEAQITNTGSKPIQLNMRVDNPGESSAQAWNAENKTIAPGQTKTLKVFFGYSYGFKPAYKLNPQAVSAVILFTGKTADELSFSIKNLEGAGWTGEKVGGDADRVSIKPPGGLLLDPSAPIKPAQIGVLGAAKGAVSADGKALQVDFSSAGKGDAVTFRPAIGTWNLNEQLEVKVKVKNAGTTAVTPSARIESEAGPSDVVTASAPLAPGAETEIVIPFAAKIPFKGVVDPTQEDPNAKGSFGAQPGTGTLYKSNNTTGVTILPDAAGGAQSLLVTSIVADLPPPPVLPDWLGKKPPVDGDWVQTLDEEFAGDTIDLHRWNVHCANWWDKRMHFSKDNVIVKDGSLILRTEKKTGYNNDDPTGKTTYSSTTPTDYASGQPDTFGKWTQRYGYFEVKEKQPTANCMWPGFWMMPDRGIAAGRPGLRGATDNGGMEFDITESQSSWGIHRFNIACHWDGYKLSHKSLGTSANYVQADKDGYITVGLLWLPGSMAVYGNGQLIFSWDSPRVSKQEAILILQNELGGWDNEPVNDAQLPADYTVKYIKVWQRKDLATPEDGPKPNKGDMDAFHETLTGTEGATPAPSK